jgi:hypothetical protein
MFIIVIMVDFSVCTRLLIYAIPAESDNKAILWDGVY